MSRGRPLAFFVRAIFRARAAGGTGGKIEVHGNSSSCLFSWCRRNVSQTHVSRHNCLSRGLPKLAEGLYLHSRPVAAGRRFARNRLAGRSTELSPPHAFPPR